VLAPSIIDYSFYKKVLFDLLISRNDSFFNYCFEQIFSRKLVAKINGESVSYDQLRLHFLSLRTAYYDAHHHHHHQHQPSHTASPFAPDGSVLKFGPFLANSTNGGREGYLAAHTVLANLINNSKWDSSPLLSTIQLESPSSSSSSSPSTSDTSSDEPEQDPESSPRKRRIRSPGSSASSSSHGQRIRYNALVVTDTMEIQWMEGKEGECRKITKFERSIRRPTSSASASSLSSRNAKQRR
jgi:hypothetical protein